MQFIKNHCPVGVKSAINVHYKCSNCQKSGYEKNKISVWSRKEKTDKQESIKQYKNEKQLENQTLNIAFQKTWRSKVLGK